VNAFRRILCPIDFSETATRALDYATALAKWYGSKLTILHVARPFDEAPASPNGHEDSGSSHLATRAGVVEELRRAAEQVDAVTLDGLALVVEEGSAHEVIVKHAALTRSDLLVVGTHGRGGFSRLFFGSVTEKVIRTAPCAVLTVPPGAVAPPTPVIFERILCPIDYCPSSLKALNCAVDLARVANGRVTALHALEYMDPDEPCEHVDAAIRRNRQRILDDARAQLHSLIAGQALDCCVDEALVIARAYKAILERATTAGADLIVMGAQGRGGVELMLYGSNTQHVVRAAMCPVLTVRA
jgi:nucleotide-binding universal stress UspA family protein